MHGGLIQHCIVFMPDEPFMVSTCPSRAKIVTTFGLISVVYNAMFFWKNYGRWVLNCLSTSEFELLAASLSFSLHI